VCSFVSPLVLLCVQRQAISIGYLNAHICHWCDSYRELAIFDHFVITIIVGTTILTWVLSVQHGMPICMN
jgi:hypothetical protein